MSITKAAIGLLCEGNENLLNMQGYVEEWDYDFVDLT